MARWAVGALAMALVLGACGGGESGSSPSFETRSYRGGVVQAEGSVITVTRQGNEAAPGVSIVAPASLIEFTVEGEGRVRAHRGRWFNIPRQESYAIMLGGDEGAAQIVVLPLTDAPVVVRVTATRPCTPAICTPLSEADAPAPAAPANAAPAPATPAPAAPANVETRSAPPPPPEATP